MRCTSNALLCSDIPAQDRRAHFVGTPDYASIQALRNHHQTPRDDLESLGYALLELTTGDVPWELTTNSAAERGWSDEELFKMADAKEKEILKFESMVGVSAPLVGALKVSWLSVAYSHSSKTSTHGGVMPMCMQPCRHSYNSPLH